MKKLNPTPHGYGLPYRCQRWFLGHHYQLKCIINVYLLFVEMIITVLLSTIVTIHICFLLLVQHILN